jgi:CheY-like chemotaxis protein
MVRMIDDLLDISRIEHGLVRLQTERVDLRQTIERVIAATQHDRQAAGQHLELFAPEQSIWVEADPVRLEQIFSNLLVNASKFTHSGGHIKVKVVLEPPADGGAGEDRQSHSEAVSVRIIDDGVGLSPQMIEQVFELFVQAESERSRASLGLGLGLPLTRQLVELHGGSISARSEGSGRGVEFDVRLPVLPATTTTATTTAAPTLAGSAAGQRVLIIDDNADAADVMKIILELADYETQVAYDGKQAMDSAKTFRPDIVVLDIYLPDTTGWELAQVLRAESGLGEALIIAVTGVDSAADRKRSAQAGIDKHLTKPVDMSVFWHIINEWRMSRRSSVDTWGEQGPGARD